MTTSTFKCPLCETPLTVYEGNLTSMASSGVTVRCNNLTCPCSENVQGFGNNEKAAYEIAKQKYTKKVDI